MLTTLFKRMALGCLAASVIVGAVTWAWLGQLAGLACFIIIAITSLILAAYALLNNTMEQVALRPNQKGKPSP